jgi:hypothetical protein
MARARATTITTITMVDAAAATRRPVTCAVSQAIIMPRRTAPTIGGRRITKDLRVAAVAATMIRGAGLGRLLGVVRGIAIGIATETEIGIEIGIEIVTGIVMDGLADAEAKCQVLKVCEAMMKVCWVRI